MENKNEELCLDFEKGCVLRGETPIMNLEELLFLLDSAVQYNSMFPIEQSQEFVAELHDRIGTGFTKEQFEEIKKLQAQFLSEKDDE